MTQNCGDFKLVFLRQASIKAHKHPKTQSLFVGHKQIMAPFIGMLLV